MSRILRRDFFAPTADIVAPALLGKILAREEGGRVRTGLITETEAYGGFEDLASHASRGRTARTEVMFGEPGHWYVYLVYGIYDMLNIVTGSVGYPSAVLIRAVEELKGPGRLTRGFGITRAFNTLPASRRSGLWIEDRGIVVPRSGIETTPRIGVAYAGAWAAKPLRFVMKKEGVRIGRPRGAHAPHEPR